MKNQHHPQPTSMQLAFENARKAPPPRVQEKDTSPTHIQEHVLRQLGDEIRVIRQRTRHVCQQILRQRIPDFIDITTKRPHA